MPISNYPVVTGGGGVQLLTRKATITTSSTWTHPDGASADEPKLVLAVVFGAGGGGGPGGGGSGASNGDGSALAGTGGGSGSIVAQELVVTGDLTVAVGASGTGGTATANSYWGPAGLRGGTTSLESTSPDNKLQATGGHGGNAGFGGNPGQWQGGVATYVVPALGGLGANQGGSSVFGVGENGSANATRDAVFPMFLAAGSGGGGGSVTPGTAHTGGTGGQSQVGNGGDGGTAANGTGTRTGSVGGNGTGYGAGGGGGGAAWSTTAYNTATGGNGGNGAPGAVIIYY